MSLTPPETCPHANWTAGVCANPKGCWDHKSVCADCRWCGRCIAEAKRPGLQQVRQLNALAEYFRLEEPEEIGKAVSAAERAIQLLRHRRQELALMTAQYEVLRAEAQRAVNEAINTAIDVVAGGNPVGVKDALATIRKEYPEADGGAGLTPKEATEAEAGRTFAQVASAPKAVAHQEMGRIEGVRWIRSDKVKSKRQAKKAKKAKKRNH